MEHILVPTDFSESADNAMNYAKYLAIEFGARITLAYIHSLPMDPMRVEGVSADLYREGEEAINRRAMQLKDVGLEVRTEVYLGTTVAKLKSIVHHNDIDLIVMGCQGENYLPTKFLGSTTTQLMDEVRTPIIAVPADFPPDFPEQFVLATDSQAPRGEDTLQPLREMVKKASTPLKVYHYQEKAENTLPDTTFRDALGKIDHEFFYQLDDGKPVERAITDFVEMAEADLVAVIHRRVNWLSKLMVVSSTRRTVWTSPVPVLILQEH